MRSFFMICSLLSLAFIATPVRADFDAIAGWDQQLFPSYIIGTSSIKLSKNSEAADESFLGEQDGLLGVAIECPEDGTPIEVTIECEGFVEPSTFSGTMSTKGTTYFVFPKVKYKFDRLSQCTQATPATVTCRVNVAEESILEKSITVTFRSINDCPLGYVVGDKKVSTSLVFASYVNEQHPFIDKLLREALDIGVVDTFTGYQAGTEEEVLRQVYALWDLMVERDVRYSSITTTAADSNMVGSQHVRMLEETINNQQANCVDGSVLFVSMLRKIGIESYLVLVPGHCYIGFYLDEQQTKTLGLETTLVGSTVDETPDTSENLENAVDEELRGEKSWPSFVTALATGSNGLESNREAFATPDSGYQIINVAVARQMGVLPIPHRSQEVFVSFDHSATETEEDSDEDDDEE